MDGTREAEYRLWYMQYGRLLIGKPGLEVDVSSELFIPLVQHFNV